MLLWAHRNAAFISLATYERFFNRVEAHEPLGRVRRRFTLGKLPRISRLIHVFDRHPPGLIDVMSESPQFRALAEIELLDDLPPGITACGLRPRDRLIVHPGPEMYDGALAVLSLEAPARPDEFGKTILVVARILSSEPAHDRSECFRTFRILLRDFDRSAIVIPAGDARVECVIFNRPDVLSQLPVQ